MKINYPGLLLPFFFTILLGLPASLEAQINFGQSNLNMNGQGTLEGVTSLTFGPDGRLYVAEYPGTIKVLTVQKSGPNNFIVTAMESLTGVKTIVNHDDDGTVNASEVDRETLGVAVGGTAANPVIYVSSSDFRIGAGTGGGNGDVDLDTNSGIITRFTWNGTAWVVVDLVRGLPRSEENHATNGLELVSINGTNYLLVAQGGHTNGGAPSKNFVYTCEYALSAALLSLNLDMLNSMPVLSDPNGRNFIYNLPTLDDPTRANSNGVTDPGNPGYNGVDVNDPFGGNDGLNQAIVVNGGPVQIYSPGYRNSYDFVVTESGALYVTDNGANGGWGGFPQGEGTAGVTNAYNATEPGSGSPTPDGEFINNKDHLQFLTSNIQTYTAGSFYGGHPNPIRANPSGAGLYTDDGSNGGVFRTLIYDPSSPGPGFTSDPNIALPANWASVVPAANAVEGDWRGPDLPNPEGPDDNEVTVWPTNTNGIDEYTATNFGGAMQGDLIAGSSNGALRRVQLNPDGSLQNLNNNFLSGLGGNALGITCNSNSDPFPGTIWAGTLNGLIVVLEPNDAVVCIEPGDPGYDANADYDSDGYTNGDEEDNGTDPCNGGSQPNDFDKLAGAPLISDFNDPDDDNDGISDANDPFQLGNPTAGGSDAFPIPIQNGLFNDQQGLGGIYGLGMTGLMNNGDPNPNWLQWLDEVGSGPNPDDVLGGAPGLMTSQMTSGTANGAANTQDKGYQYGVQVDQNSGSFTVTGNLINFAGALQLYGNNAAVGGELGLFIGDGTQSNFIKFVISQTGLTALQEINDVPQAPISVPVPIGDRPAGAVIFYFIINPSNGNVELQYAFDSEAPVSIGNLTAQGSILTAIQQAGNDLAVGFIGTSNTPGVELEGTWDYLNVTGSAPAIETEFPDITRYIGAADEDFDLDAYFIDDAGDDNLTYTVQGNTNPAIGASISGNILTLSYPGAPEVSSLTIRATDEDSNFIDLSFDVSVTEAPEVLYRVNSGGPAITSIDSSPDWEADTAASPSAYLSQPGTNSAGTFGMTSYTAAINQTTTPVSIFDTERFDQNVNPPDLTYSFPVAADGVYEVRLYMGNGFNGTNDPGERIFNVAIEGLAYPALTEIDLSGQYGHKVGTVITHGVEVTDGTLDITFLHGVENPLINGVEILDVADDQLPIYIFEITDQTSNPGEQLNGSLGVNALGGDGNLSYAASGLPPGLTIEPTNGQIGGTVDASAEAGSPYNVTITVDDSDGVNTDAATTSFNWTIGASFVWVNKDESEDYTARHENSFVQAGDKFYLMGGRENSKTVEIYDYTSNSWAALTDSAPLDFNHFQATEYQGLIWVIGAFQDNIYPNETPAEFIWAFDPAAEVWIQGPEIPVARRRGGAGVVVYDDKFYIVGGNTIGHSGGYVAYLDEYDPATGIWTPLADAPRARDHFAAVAIGDNMYLAGGRLTGGPGGVFSPTIPEVDVYNLTTGSWSTLPAGQNIPTQRASASSVNFNGSLLVIGGETAVAGPALATTEAYDPVSQSWSTLASLNSPRHGTQAIVSGNGIFIAAGSPVRGGGNQKNMEYYGVDAPEGSPSVASMIDAPSGVLIADGATEDASLITFGGNVGLFVTSMTISGTNAADFQIVGGELVNQLISVNSTHTISIQLNGTGADRNALLTINYANGESTDIVLSNTNGPPVAVAEATPVSGTAPLEVQFTGSNSTDAQSEITYLWDFMDGSATSTEADPTHTFTADGIYNVLLTVTDVEGLTDTASITITVGQAGDNPPVAVIMADPMAGAPPLEVNFIGRNSTDDLGIESYLWDFGDGSTSDDIDPVHVFTEVGQFEVTLTVTDSDGLTDTASVTIFTDGSGGGIRGIILENPSKDGIAKIRVINKPDDLIVMRIYLHDSSGRLIDSFEAQQVFQSTGYFEIPVGTFRDGLYFVGLEMNQGDPLLIKLLIKN